jgi:hypothetical protein
MNRDSHWLPQTTFQIALDAQAISAAVATSCARL